MKSRSLLRKSPLFIINCQLVIMKISTVYNKISICYHEYKSHVLAQLAFHNLLKDVWWNFFTKIINDLTGFQILLPKAHFHIFDSWKCCLLIMSWMETYKTIMSSFTSLTGYFKLVINKQIQMTFYINVLPNLVPQRK